MFLSRGGGGFRCTLISRSKSTAKFPTRNSGFSANFSHTSGTHCGVWQVVIHSTRGLCEISHREFDSARNFPPSCSDLSCNGLLMSD